MASFLKRKVGAAMNWTISTVPVKEQLLRYVGYGSKPAGERTGSTRRSAGPARKLRFHEAFRRKPGVQVEMQNPLEPDYYRYLPDWLRAEGAYAPIEVGKIIFYLLIPIFAILALGSRNFSVIQNLLFLTQNHYNQATKLTYEDQLKGWRKTDEEGIPSHYSANKAMPGSTLERKRIEEAAEASKKTAAAEAAEQASNSSTTSADAPTEYFAIMAKLRERQRQDAAARGELGAEADQIVKDSKMMTRSQGMAEQF